MSKIILIATVFAFVSLLFALVPLFDTNLFCVEDSVNVIEFSWTGFSVTGFRVNDIGTINYNSDEWRLVLEEIRYRNLTATDITLPLTTANVLESIGAGMLGLTLLLIFLLLFWPERIGLKRSAFGFSVVGFIFLLAAAVTFQANWKEIKAMIDVLLYKMTQLNPGSNLDPPTVILCRDAIFLWTSVGTSLLTAIVMLFVVRG
jgi:hypothetical protein